MSTLETTQEHLTTAALNGHSVVVHQAHRIAGHRYGPVLVTVSAPVTLTLEEMTALLYTLATTHRWSDDPLKDLNNDATVRDFVAHSLINDGCLAVDDAMAGAFGAGDVDLLGYCRARALTVFTSSADVGEVAR
ncbi:MAG: hypothetical protein JO115_21430 [Pseudonocardiales bacterium]|nr:hypothetical protein [Pseudonocardiales bacterium]